jgi:phospholipid/cholesterol/gamma-HCH transport system substrate-binding protein
MADPRKIRWAKLKVGLVAIGSFIILSYLIFLLTSSRGLFQSYVLLRTYMDDAGGIAEGSLVRLNGITVGYLERLRLSGSRDPKRTVEFDMMVKDKYLRDIPVDSMTGIAAANLLGDKFLNITKGRSQQIVLPGGELQSQQTQDIPELMASMANLLQSFQGIVNRVDSLLAGVEQGKGNIGKLLKDEQLYDRLNGIASEGQKLLSDIRTGHGTMSKLIYDDELYKEVQAPLKRIDAILADLQGGQGTAGKLLKDPALYDELHRTVAEIRTLVADVNAGKGTAGKLLKDEELYSRFNELALKLTTTVDKINSGQGTMGQLIVNPALYESLTGATREFQSLAKDMRANPKKFLTIRLTLF